MPQGSGFVDVSRTKIKEHYDEIVQLFEEGQDIETNDALELSTTLQIIADQIHNRYNIPRQLIWDEYRFSLNEQQNLGLSIPDIPTYQIRFGLEIGSWFVFLHKDFDNLLFEQFDRLLELEEVVFDTDKKQNEDYAYYTLEVKQVVEKNLLPLFPIWEEEFEKFPAISFAKRLISAIYDVSISRDNALIEGAERILKLKLAELSKFDSSDLKSQWILEVDALLGHLRKSFEEGQYGDSLYLSVLVVLTGLHRANALRKEEKERQKLEKDDDPVKVLTDIGYYIIDPNDEDSFSAFSDRLMMTLYNRPEIDPIAATTALIRLCFQGLNMHHSATEGVVSEITDEVDALKKEYQEPLEFQLKLVEYLERKLPSIFLSMKVDIKEFEKAYIIGKEVQELPFWDGFEEGLKRLSRSDDSIGSLKIANSAIKSAYQELISRSLLPIDSLKYLKEKLEELYPTLVSELDSIFLDIEESLSATTVLSEQDKIVYDELGKQIHSLLFKDN